MGLKFTFLILCLLLVYFVYLISKFHTEKYYQVKEQVSLQELLPILKTGDILLFQAKNASFVRNIAVFGRWTHVAVVHKRLKDGKLFVWEGGPVHRYQLLENHLKIYSSAPTFGNIVVRSLNQPLRKEQEEQFELFLQTHMEKSRTNTSLYKKIIENERGEWEGFLINYYGTKNTREICLFRYILDSPIPFDSTKVILCTDMLLLCLANMNLLKIEGGGEEGKGKKEFSLCTSPNFFNSINEEEESLNEFIKYPYFYEKRLKQILVFSPVLFS